MAEVFTIPLAPYVAAYDRDGFVKIPGVFTPEEMGHLKFAAEATVKTHPERVTWSNRRPMLLIWPQKLSPALAAFVQDEKIKTLLDAFIGGGVYRQTLNQVHFRGPYSTEEFGWHQDKVFRTPYHDFCFCNILADFLQVMIVVDPMELNNAPLELIPGSHLQGDLKLLRNESDPRIGRFVRDRVGHKMQAQPGDIVLWSMLTVHGSDANRSGASRMTYLSGFVADRAVVGKGRCPLWSPVDDAIEAGA